MVVRTMIKWIVIGIFVLIGIFDYLLIRACAILEKEREERKHEKR